MSTQTDDPDKTRLQATAYHEAGHAVMAISLGRSVQKVTVQPRQMVAGGVRLGTCELKKGRSQSSKHSIEEEVLVLFAGMVAEARHTGRYCHRGASQDLQAIKRLLQHRARGEKQLERAQQRLLSKTEHLLGDEANALAIEWIARELLERGSVSGRAVQRFYDLALKQTS